MNKLVVRDITSLRDERPSENVQRQWTARKALRKQVDVPDHLISVRVTDGRTAVTGAAETDRKGRR